MSTIHKVTPLICKITVQYKQHCQGINLLPYRDSNNQCMKKCLLGELWTFSLLFIRLSLDHKLLSSLEIVGVYLCCIDRKYSLRIVNFGSFFSPESGVAVKIRRVVIRIENQDRHVGSTFVRLKIFVQTRVRIGPIPSDDLKGEFGFSFPIEVASNVNAAVFRVQNDWILFGYAIF